MANTVTVERMDRNICNMWLNRVHYIHKPVARSKMLGYACRVDGDLQGAMLWSAPPFTSKRGLFGYPGRLDKYEVLVLARFYMSPALVQLGVTPTWFIAEVLGRTGRKARSHMRGWRVQEDWVREHPPIWPDKPFVPRLLLSYSDGGLLRVERCPRCGATHNGEHVGTIYAASGWTRWGDTVSEKFRMGAGKYQAPRTAGSAKTCWILRLLPNERATVLGRQLFAEKERRVSLGVSGAVETTDVTSATETVV
jgi:hypothetical protein